MARMKVAVASRSLTECAALTEWLEEGGYHVMPIVDAAMPASELEALGFEVLVIDAELMNVGSLMRVARYRATPRPVLVIGDADPEVEADAERQGASFIVRPIEPQPLHFALTLAVAEGRPTRRSERRPMPGLPATVDGIAARIVDISYEGVRVELPASERAALPEEFTLTVPLLNTAVHIQRVWVASDSTDDESGILWCGGALARNPQSSEIVWRLLVDKGPSVAA